MRRLWIAVAVLMFTAVGHAGKATSTGLSCWICATAAFIFVFTELISALQPAPFPAATIQCASSAQKSTVLKIS